jgi:hypothetical protein
MIFLGNVSEYSSSNIRSNGIPKVLQSAKLVGRRSDKVKPDCHPMIQNPVDEPIFRLQNARSFTRRVLSLPPWDVRRCDLLPE